MYFHKLLIGLILGFVGGYACKTAIDHKKGMKIKKDKDVIDVEVS